MNYGYKNIILGATLSCLSVSAHATLMLSLDDTNIGDPGTAEVVVTDNGTGDTIADTGALQFSGTVGGWSIFNAFAQTNPFLGDEYTDQIHFDSVVFGEGELILMLTQTGLSRSEAPYLGGFGGFTNGSMDFELFIDADNTAFGTTTSLFDTQSFANGGFGSNFYGGISTTNPYSMTMVVTVSHENVSTSSSNYDVKIPEPASLSLLGLGLIGLGFTARRRKNNRVA